MREHVCSLVQRLCGKLVRIRPRILYIILKLELKFED
jgi:hypothetical protein